MKTAHGIAVLAGFLFLLATICAEKGMMLLPTVFVVIGTVLCSIYVVVLK